MSSNFNADEILEMAVKIEQNGQLYYSKAAELVEDSNVKKLLNDLSMWEVQHEKTFNAMRAKFAAQQDFAAAFDLDSEAARYLQAIADGKVFSTKKMDDELAGITPEPKPILERAIQREKDAIVFFVAMKEMVNDPEGRDDVEKIIQEEYSHIRYLTDKIAVF